MEQKVIKQAIEKISALVSKAAGIQLGERQAHMVEGRVRTRMLRLGIEDFETYLHYLEEHHDTESSILLSLLTTHHTFFFREWGQLELIRERYLSSMCDAARKRGDRILRCWSAAASRGQEAYSLAMYLRLHLAQIAPDIGLQIVGTDIDPESINIARNGVYNVRELHSVPLVYQQGLWIKGTGEIADFVSAKKALRDQVRFEVHNILDKVMHPFAERFDLILCRNLFIYFVAEQVEMAVRKLEGNLSSAGLLLLGLSEPLNGIATDMQTLGQSIYVPPSSLHVQPKVAKVSAPVLAKAPETPKSPERQSIRVLVVDDSPSVAALLRRALLPEHGFEVVGHASDGAQAATMVAKLKPDALTLDIHMPGTDGLTYLRQNFRAAHPPVVMVSSVARDEANLALEALRLGASDYVEKPSLADFEKRSEELRVKLKSAILARGKPMDLSLEKQLAKTTAPAARKATSLRLVVTASTNLEQLAALLDGLRSDNATTVLLLANSAVDMAAASRALTHNSKRPVHDLLKAGAGGPTPGGVWLAKAAPESVTKLASQASWAPTSIMIIGRPDENLISALGSDRGWRGAQILLEDLGSRLAESADPWRRVASDIVPVTSFAYLSDRYLDGKICA